MTRAEVYFEHAAVAERNFVAQSLSLPKRGLRTYDCSSFAIFPKNPDSSPYQQGSVTIKLIMLMLSFFSWWYGPGLIGLVRTIQRRMQQLADMFSVAILLRTLFSPWRRIITYPGAGLEAHLRAMLDNMVSRVIGLLVRVSVLLAATILFVLLAIVSALQIILWPLLPLIAIGLIGWGSLK